MRVDCKSLCGPPLGGVLPGWGRFSVLSSHLNPLFTCFVFCALSGRFSRSVGSGGCVAFMLPSCALAFSPGPVALLGLCFLWCLWCPGCGLFRLAPCDFPSFPRVGLLLVRPVWPLFGCAPLLGSLPDGSGRCGCPLPFHPALGLAVLLSFFFL